MITPVEIKKSQIILKDGTNVLSIGFVGELDESNIDDVAKEVYAILDSSFEGAFIILDLNELGYMNSKSIGYISDWYTKLIERASKLAIIGAKGNILDVLETVGLDGIIPMYPDVDALVASKIFAEKGAKKEEKVEAKSETKKKE